MNRIPCFRHCLFAVSLRAVRIAHPSPSQPREGTVEASWKRAEQERDLVCSRPHRIGPPVMSSHPGKRKRQTGHGLGRARVPKTTRPWPSAARESDPKGLPSASTLSVIDSLSHLYCLSPGYVTTLRSRNDDAITDCHTRYPKERAFSYSAKVARATAKRVKPSRRSRRCTKSCCSCWTAAWPGAERPRRIPPRD
jgi:hypothetical protein